MKTDGSWIDIEFKEYYINSAKQTGLRLFFQKDCSQFIKNEVHKYVKFLKKRYYFPIKCNIHFRNQEKFHSYDQKGYTYGIFFEGENEKKTYPSIYIPIAGYNENECDEILYNLTILLTYYFQWYFMYDEKDLSKELENEAKIYADYLVYKYRENK